MEVTLVGIVTTYLPDLFALIRRVVTVRPDLVCRRKIRELDFFTLIVATRATGALVVLLTRTEITGARTAEEESIDVTGDCAFVSESIAADRVMMSENSDVFPSARTNWIHTVRSCVGSVDTSKVHSMELFGEYTRAP